MPVESVQVRRFSSAIAAVARQVTKVQTINLGFWQTFEAKRRAETPAEADPGAAQPLDTTGVGGVPGDTAAAAPLEPGVEPILPPDPAAAAPVIAVEEPVAPDPAAVDPASFNGLTVIPVAGRPVQDANVVRLPDGKILVPEQFLATAEVVSGAGFDTVSCNTSEFARADGGLTCLSLRIRGQ